MDEGSRRGVVFGMVQGLGFGHLVRGCEVRGLGAPGFRGRVCSIVGGSNPDTLVDWNCPCICYGHGVHHVPAGGDQGGTQSLEEGPWKIHSSAHWWIGAILVN